MRELPGLSRSLKQLYLNTGLATVHTTTQMDLRSTRVLPLCQKKTAALNQMSKTRVEALFRVENGTEIVLLAV
jgi:hypothetical protein